MQYRNLGNTGLLVSRLSFGAMTFTQGNRNLAQVYKVGAELADQLVGQSLDAGVNFFDTADVYAAGESEALLGQALRPHRKDVVIATKVGGRMGEPLNQAGLSRRHILASVDDSLRRLGTDWIDVYIVHKEDPLTPMEETLEALDSIVRAGKVRYIGFSNWSAWKVSKALEIQRERGLARFSHGQVYYSLLGRDIERDLVPLAEHYNLGLTIWSPLAFGFLSGKYTREMLTDPESRVGGFNLLPFDADQGFAVVDLLRGIAAARGVSVAQVALAWLLSRSAVTSVLMGASKAEQLTDNLGAADLILSAEEVSQLDAATPLPPVYPHWYIDRFGDEPALKALGRI